MNYLAHAFLADKTDEYLIGSFIGDFIKGTIKNQYSHEMTSGIILHRKVDAFADSHSLTRAGREMFAGPRRRYAGIVLDICYDHFLARHWPQYADSQLPEFVLRVYRLLQEYSHLLPERLKKVLPRLLKENWLESYQTLKGVEFSLKRISKRLRHEVRLDKSIQEIESNYKILEHNFNSFFPDVIGFTREWMDNSI